MTGKRNYFSALIGFAQGYPGVLFKIDYFRKGWVKKSIYRLLLAEYFADEITFAQVRNNTFTNIIWEKFKHI